MSDPESPAIADDPHRLGVRTVSPHDTAFFGHPRGLSTLFFTEMWERFSYYGMRALLILFMTAAASEGGLGFDTASAGAVYGLYTSMVYMACLPGGWVADRLIGQRRAVLWGGILIASGHFSMAFPSLVTFYLGLLLIVLGTGLLKGNISVLVGTLYGEGDNRRDAGFSLYYVGINLGAFLAPLVCGYLGQRVNWHLGFAAAGIGMVLGLVQYVFGGKYLGQGGLKPAVSTADEYASNRTRAIISALIFVIIVGGVGVGAYTGMIPVTPTQIADWAGYLLLIVVVAFFGWLFASSSWSADERKRLYAITVFFIAAALFWSLFEQAGSTLNLFADRDTRTSVLGREFPSTWFQSMNSMFVFSFAAVFAWLWLALGRRGKEPSTTVKFSLGLILVGAGFAVLIVAAQLAAQGVQVSPMWLTVTYLLHTFGELCLSPVGLSAMTKLAPARIAGLVMGVWFLATSVGNFIAGRLSGFYESMPLPTLFTNIALFGIVAGLILLPLAPSMKRMMGEIK
jgi:proton-dependent oligopeptide transporter, POT family